MTVQYQEVEGTSLRPMSDALNECLGFQSNGSEQKIHAEVIKWITVRPKLAYRLRLTRKVLALFGGSTMLTSLVVAFSNRVTLGLNSDGLTLSALLVGGGILAFPLILSFGKDLEPDDDVILSAMESTNGRRQMSALLALRRQFADGHRQLIFQNSEGNRSPVPSDVFRRQNSLNLLLPALGTRHLVSGVDGLQFGKFFVAGATATKAIDHEQLRLMEGRDRVKYLFECDDNVFFEESAVLSLAAHSDAKTELAILKSRRSKRMESEAADTKVYKNIHDEEVGKIHSVSRRQVERVRSGLTGLAKKIVFPGE